MEIDKIHKTLEAYQDIMSFLTNMPFHAQLRKDFFQWMTTDKNFENRFKDKKEVMKIENNTFLFKYSFRSRWKT